MDDNIKNLIISAFVFMDVINQRSDVMVYDFDSGQAMCQACGGKSAEGERAAGWVDIKHGIECPLDQFQKSLKPFKAIWMAYLHEKCEVE